MPPDTAPYDALLLVSFGGPERPEDVLPFLQNVTAGRNIPDERLEEVGEHYHLFGGRSPINDQNRQFVAAIVEDLRSTGVDIPVYWGNRYWEPYLAISVVYWFMTLALTTLLRRLEYRLARSDRG